MNRDGTQYRLHTGLCIQSQHCTPVCYVRWNGDTWLNGLLINIKIKDLTLFFLLLKKALNICLTPQVNLRTGTAH